MSVGIAKYCKRLMMVFVRSLFIIGDIPFRNNCAKFGTLVCKYKKTICVTFFSLVKNWQNFSEFYPIYEWLARS